MTAAQVREFHEVFGHPVEPLPTVADVKTRQLRLDLIAEEFDELAEASGALWDCNAERWIVQPDITPDLVAMADALGDIEYVVDGAGHAFGIDLDAVVTEIHRSNMSKLGPDGKPVPHPTVPGKIGKGPNYSEPDLAPILFLDRTR